MGVADELARLIARRDAGELTDEEFQAAKSELLSHPERARAEVVAPDSEPVSTLRRRNRRRALVVAGVIVLALVAWVVVSEAFIGGPRLEVRVTGVTALSNDLVSVHARVTNVGGRSALGVCQVSVSVPGGSGSSPSQPILETSAPVPPGGSATASVEVAVTVGAARHVTSRDFTFSCQ